MRIFILSILLCSICLFSFAGEKVSFSKLKFDHFSTLHNIPEPSDIAYDKETNHYFIVSDNGMLFECELNGKAIRQAAADGYDFEGVEVRDSFVYVSDETPRIVYKYRKSDLSLVKKYDVAWNGAMNKAFESLAYNEAKKCFVLISEMPAVIVEYDENFHELGRYPFHHARDISSARWHNGNMYLLSDMDASIFQCDPVTYEVKKAYKISILNPEGLAWDDKGNMVITSDALDRIYFFNNDSIIKQ